MGIEGCHHSGGKGSGEAAAVDHGGDQDDAQCSHGSRAGTGDGSKEHAGHDGHVGQAAVFPAQECVSNAQQTAGNTAGSHQLAGQNEKRNGHQGEGVTTCDQGLCHVSRLHNTAAENRCEAGQAQRNADRHPQNQTQNQNAKEYSYCHFLLHSFLMCCPDRFEEHF